MLNLIYFHFVTDLYQFKLHQNMSNFRWNIWYSMIIKSTSFCEFCFAEYYCIWDSSVFKYGSNNLFIRQNKHKFVPRWYNNPCFRDKGAMKTKKCYMSLAVNSTVDKMPKSRPEIVRINSTAPIRLESKSSKFTGDSNV